MLYTFKTLTAFLTFAIAFAFGYAPIKYKESSLLKSHLIKLTFTDGIFVGIALLHLLPEALELTESTSVTSHQIYVAFFLSIIVAAMPFILELFLPRTLSKQLNSHIFMLLLSFHALLEGLCLGIKEFRNHSIFNFCTATA